MTKEEYVKTLKKSAADEVADIIHDDYCDGYVDGLKKAIDLAEKLDEPEKVVIPKFIANDIKYHKKYGWVLRGALRSAFDPNEERDVYDWFLADDGDENIRKYISAWSNGYEVEKEPKYHVKIKHFNSSDNGLYVNHNNARGDFFLEGKKQTPSVHTIFTKSYLKSHWTGYEAYNNAGLLEFEEVEDEAR